MKSKTTLTIHPTISFLTGVARLVDLGGSLNTHPKLERTYGNRTSDRNALASDWGAVGQDMRVSLSKYEQKLKKQPESSHAR